MSGLWMWRVVLLLGAVFIAALALLALAIFGPAWPQETHPPPGAADPYLGLKDALGRDCCAGIHCHPVLPEHARMNGETVEILDNPSGQWLPVPDSAVLTRRGAEFEIPRSPDDRLHACVLGPTSEREVRCVLLPSLL